MNERAQRLLRVLVQSYIRDGQPVGSRALSRDSGLALSSATIRNVMADLEELGFVSSPHTSAGRVPTDKAIASSSMRCCARELPAAESAELEDLREQLRRHARGTPRRWSPPPRSCCRSITHLAGVVTLPLAPAATLTQIEFLALSENRVLVILVFNDREVQNRIIQLERHYGPRSCGARPTS